jgi:hypothetical protein
MRVLMTRRWLQPNVPEDPEYITSPLFWALAGVTGVGAGLAGGLLMLLLQRPRFRARPCGFHRDQNSLEVD